jgi:peptidoglycan-N-acetylglucosamine deacetylase
MSRLPTPSAGLLLAVLVLGVAAVVVNGQGTAGTGSANALPSAAASAQQTAVVGSPTAKAGTKSPLSRKLATPSPTRRTASSRPSDRMSTHATDTPKSRPAESPPSPASRKQRARASDQQPAKGRGTVSLTFDDGPSQYTPAILGILRAMHSTATFFELGFRQAQHPTEAAQIRAQGSSVGNHTYNHPDLAALTPRQIQWQLAHGPRSRCVRPPYGATNRTVERILSRQGLREVLWTIDTRDWSRPGTKRIVQAATGPSVRAGSIVLMHDGGGDRSETVAALPQIIAALQHQGYVVRRIPGC